MRGRIVCVGVGPGDPELMTLKAVRLIREADVIAAPGDPVSGTVAFRIALEAVPEIAAMEHLGIVMPMSRDPEVRKKAHRKGAGKIEEVLDQGKQIVFLTLGDPSIYSTFPLLKRILDADGYEASFVSGVPSFCAAAALLGEPLVQQEEPLYILPNPDGLEFLLHQSGRETGLSASLKDSLPDPPDLRPATDARNRYPEKDIAKDQRECGDGIRLPAPDRGSRHPKSGFLPDATVVLMKSGRRFAATGVLPESLYDVRMVENCGMEQESVYRDGNDFPEKAGYFSLLIGRIRRLPFSDQPGTHEPERNF